jgi:hypothetical protein|tara:strand:+ start:1427 stop:1615 length:189 start_codon:yes stop_codon:yes gene_type:complete
MKEALSNEKLETLREQNIINEQEVVYKVGDLFVAENILTGSKRQLNIESVLSEGSNKRILKG